MLINPLNVQDKSTRRACLRVRYVSIALSCLAWLNTL